MNPPPIPFGDPGQVRLENQHAVGRGILTGCGGCLLVIIGAGAVIACLFFAIFGALRTSDVSTEAMARASAAPEVRLMLGSPIERGWMLNGNINLNGSGGTAAMSFPISGPKGGATVRATAHKEGGVWIFTTLEVIPDKTGKPIDLLAPVSVT